MKHQRPQNSDNPGGRRPANGSQQNQPGATSRSGGGRPADDRARNGRGQNGNSEAGRQDADRTGNERQTSERQNSERQNSERRSNGRSGNDRFEDRLNPPEQRSSDERNAKVLGAGTPAPDFELKATPDQLVDLNHFKGRPVVLVFYPADWSPVCGDQLALYNEILSEFQKYGAQVVGISVDGVWCHVAHAQQRKLHFPLLADSIPRARSPAPTGCTAIRTGCASVPCS